MHEFCILDYEPYTDAAGPAAAFVLHLSGVRTYANVYYSIGGQGRPGVFYREPEEPKGHFSRSLSRKITWAIQALLDANAPASPFYIVEAGPRRPVCRVPGPKELVSPKQPVQLDLLGGDNVVYLGAQARQRRQQR